MKSFREKVWDAAARIPRGKVATYGDIARAIGSPRAARAVGACLSANKDTKRVPCHRVVASDGSLTGYAFGGVKEKKKLLLAEGVTFRGARVDLSVSCWRQYKARK